MFLKVLKVSDRYNSFNPSKKAEWWKNTVIRMENELGTQKTIEELDKWIADGRFKNRSDAIRSILSFYQEREKTREFYKMLNQRSKESKEQPETLPLEELE